MAMGSRKGTERLSPTNIIEVSFKNDNTPGSIAVDWHLHSPGYVETNFSNEGERNHNGCGNWNNELLVAGNVFDNTHRHPTDNTRSDKHLAHTVSDGGECKLKSSNGAKKSSVYEINGTDFTLRHWPLKRGTNPHAPHLVDTSNPDNPENEWWVSNKSILIWIPAQDISTNTNEKFTINANLIGHSISGQPNEDPVDQDNWSTVMATNKTAGNMYEVHTPPIWSNPTGLDFSSKDPLVTGDSRVNQVAPGQILSARLTAGNKSTSPLPAGYICEKLDNARLSFFDIRGESFKVSSKNHKDDDTGVITRHLSGPEFPITWEIGINGTGVSNHGTWATYNRIDNEYNAPSTAGSTQSDSLCGNNDATWYSSIEELVNAEGPDSINKITRIRGSYDTFPAGSEVLIFIPQQANSTYGFHTKLSKLSESGQTEVSKGESTINSFAVHQMLWKTNEPEMFNEGVGRSSDAVLITQTEYATIRKSSTSHQISGSLAESGSTISYSLSINLSTSGSAHTSDVSVWDVIPKGLSYIQGSSTFGGVEIADPICLDTNLPLDIFPGGDSLPPPGSTPEGFKACKWSLTGQHVEKSLPGHVAADLPTLQYDASIEAGVETGTSILTSAAVTSTNNILPLPVYSGETIGFSCRSGNSCSFGNWLLSAQKTPGIILNKAVSSEEISVGDELTYEITYGATGESLDDVRIVNIFPYSLDRHTPASTFSGSLELAELIANPVHSSQLKTSGDSHFLALYTKKEPSGIAIDPYHSQHIVNGKGNNSNTETIWCAVEDFGSGECPNTVESATAAMLLPSGKHPISATIDEGKTYKVTLKFRSLGNSPGDIYSSSFMADSPSLTARRPSSNTVSTRVTAPDLNLTKTVTPDTASIGSNVSFELQVKTDKSSFSSPIAATNTTTIRVIDQLPEGLRLAEVPSASENWDCSASISNTVDCTYTGGYPLGVGTTVGSPIRFTTRIDESVEDNAWIANLATVTLEGLAEPNTENNTAKAWVRVNRPADLSLQKSVDRASTTQTGTADFTLTASLDPAGGRATGGPIVVTDTLPAGLSFGSASDISGTDWDCSASAAPSTVSCTYSGAYPVAVGDQVGGAITVSTQVDASAAPGDLRNTASVSFPGEENTANNTASATLTVEAALASVSGSVFLDANTDGALDGADSGVAGVSLALCQVEESPCSAANTLDTTTSGADGRYQFAAVGIGNFYVVQTQPAGYGSSTADTVPVTRSALAPVPGADFGETLGKLSGYVYSDLDRSGDRAAATENGVGTAVDVVLLGTTVDHVTGADKPVEIRVSADSATGFYQLENIPAPKPGTGYTLAQSPSLVAGYSNGTSNAGDLQSSGPSASAGSANSANSLIDNIRFAPSAAPVLAPTINGINFNFGEVPQAGISGRVYLDSDLNGVPSQADAGLGGVMLTLCRVNEQPCAPANTVASTTSAANGGYHFDGIPAGNYWVLQQQPAAYGSVSRNIVAVTRVGDQPVTDADFGERGAVLGGQVYVDADKSGDRGPGDTAYTQGTATISLSGTGIDGTAVAISQAVDSNGRYAFTDVPAPDASGYRLSLAPASVTAPYVATSAHAGAISLTDGGSGNAGTVSGLAVNGLNWSVSNSVGSGSTATGIGYDFGVMTGASLSGRVMRDSNRNGSGNSTSDPEDKPEPGVTITLCASAASPCPPADTLDTQSSDANGEYRFAEVLPGSYWVQQTQPSTLGNGPGATDSHAIVLGSASIADLDFLDRAGSLSGTVFSDVNVNAANDSEPGVAGVTLTLSGTDAAGNAVQRTTTTDSDGNYHFDDLPAPGPAGYALRESGEPANTRDGTAFLGQLSDAHDTARGVSGRVDGPDSIDGIALPPGGAGNDYDFSELPATASVSGSVWRDRDSDRTYSGDEDAVPGWTVQLLHIDPVDGGTTVVAEQVTGTDGKYNFTGQIPGDYQIVFRSPTRGADGKPMVWGSPVNGEGGTPMANSNAEIGDGIIRRISLLADVAIEQQSLPLDPSGVVYDSEARTPIPGATVTLVGPPGYNPGVHLLGGTAANVQTTAGSGEYQFLLTPTAPAGEYSLQVEAPAGYNDSSSLIPAEPGVLTPPVGPADVFAVVPSALAPQQGEPTTYYTRFDLTPGVSSGVVHNHIPLDPQVMPALFVTKQADRSTAELGDSIKYTVQLHNRGTADAPALAVEDTLPLGFKYIAGTAKLSRDGAEPQTLEDPAGAPGPELRFALPGSLPPGETLSLSYRARAGVGADHGDGINRATGVTGALRSPTAEARVLVSGGVLGDEACLAGRVFVDCNRDHIQNGEELGIPGVRLYLQDGRYLVTDVEGKYSSCDLKPQTHVLKVDRMTLPRASRLTTSSNRNLGDAHSLFVDLKAGELHRADFIEGSCTSVVLEQVRARRNLGETNAAHIEARGAASLSQRHHSDGVPRGTVSSDQALVRQRPAGAAKAPLQHEQDLPGSAQQIDESAPFFRSLVQTVNELLDWDERELATLELHSDVDRAPASGLEAVALTVSLKDERGHPLPGKQLVTLSTDGGFLWLPGQDTAETGLRGGDLDPNVPGLQTWAHDGELTLSLLAPDQPQRVKVRVRAAQLSAEREIEFTPALREWIAAGLIEGTISLTDKAGLSATGASGLFERELQQWQRSFDNGNASAAARVAFFVKGTIKGKYLLTATFDSEKGDRERILQDIDPERLYPVFGDASLKGFEAQSSDKLFVRLSRDQHYLLYGDFQSANGTAELGAYNRTLTGGQLRLENELGSVDVYAARDTLRQQVQELTPNGTSGPYGIDGTAVENTERVELIVRDRNLPSRVLERRQLQRLVDYTFDAFTGRLLFKEPVSRTDGDGNPQAIRVSYEQDGDGEASWAAGLRAEGQLNELVRLGASYHYNELDALAEDELSELASVDLAVAINDWLSTRVEVARSVTQRAGEAPERSGDASKVEIRAGHEAGSWSAVLHAVTTDTDFNNPNASVDGGREEAGMRLRTAISAAVDAESELLRHSDKTTGSTADSAYLGLKLRPTDGFAVSAGLRHLRDNGRGLLDGATIDNSGSIYSGSGLNSAGAGLFGSGENATSTVDGDPLESTSLLLGADWRVNDKLSLGVEAEDSFDGDETWRATATAGWQLNSQQTLQARYETQTGLGSTANRRQKSRAFVFGLTRNFDEDGSNFAELRLRDGLGGREAHLAYGVRNGFDIGSGLRGVASAEQVAVLDGSGRTATSGALGVSHTTGERWKGSARVEARRLHDNDATAEDDSADSWLANLSLARKLDDSWTALGKVTAMGSDDKAADGDQSQQRVQVGAAYRPVDHNRVAVVGKLEHRRERNSELAQAESRDLWVASVSGNWHPTRAWWLGARLATKDVDESLEGVQDSYRASLAGVRATHDVTEHIDIGVISNYRYSPDGHTEDWAAGLELGYAVQTNLWLSLGYNWGGFSDRDLSGADYTQRGWYIRLRYKFDEDLFNGANPEANRSLPRQANK